VKKTEDIESIIAGCIEKKRSSQERLFKLYYGKLMGATLRYTNDNDTAQEIVQEGFIKIFEKITKFENTGSFEGWMRRIVVNTAIDYLRKSKRDNWVQENEINTKDEYSNPTEENELQTALEIKAEYAIQAIQELSPAYRTVFNLYVIENYSHKEISELLGISEGTSKSNLSKAKFNLQKIISQHLSSIENE
jgi:RNA polymerase sigma-70 factor (ECF subfamily)